MHIPFPGPHMGGTWKLVFVMKHAPKTPLAARAIAAGIVMLGLAACQPATTVPGNASVPSPGATTPPTVVPKTTTTTAVAPADTAPAQ